MPKKIAVPNIELTYMTTERLVKEYLRNDDQSIMEELERRGVEICQECSGRGEMVDDDGFVVDCQSCGSAGYG